MTTPELHVTLWPSFGHFARFGRDDRLAGIRLNSAMMTPTELDGELARARDAYPTVPLWFDVKGRQPRVEEVHPNDDHLDLTLNHPISVETPVVVLFKAGADQALLDHLEEDGRRLVFRGGPHYAVRPGESLHVRHPSFRIGGPIFTDAELAKIAKVKAAGFTRWYLSYVEDESDVDLFLEVAGRDAEVRLKIENERGLDYVARRYRPRPNVGLVAARGDLYVEIARPHRIVDALKLVVAKDPDAMVGSRILLSVIHEPVPSCADWCELAWLGDIGYRRMLLCDELCLKEPLLATAVNAFDEFRNDRRLPARGSTLKIIE